MRPADLKKVLNQKPFEPIQLGLTDGRSVVIKHPDQVVVTERQIFVGLAKLEVSPPLATPASASTVAKDWLWVNLLHIATIEPAGRNGSRKTKRRHKP